MRAATSAAAVDPLQVWCVPTLQAGNRVLYSHVTRCTTQWEVMGSKAAAARAVLRASVDRSAWQRGRAARRQQSLRRCCYVSSGIGFGGSSACDDDAVCSCLLTNPPFNVQMALRNLSDDEPEGHSPPAGATHTACETPPTNPPSPPINCSAMQYNQQTQLHRSACNVTPYSEPTDLTLVEAEMRVVYEKYACDGFSWVV